MSRLLDELRSAGQLAILPDARKGSLLDQSGHGLSLTVGAGSGNKFNRTPKGSGYSGTTSSEYTAGVQASLDLTAATAFVAFISTKTHTVNASLLSKAETLSSIKNGYTIALTGAIYCALGDASGVQGVNAAAVEPVGVPTLVAMGWNGTNLWTWVNGVQTKLVAQTRVPTSVGQAFRFGRSASYGLADVSVLFGGVVNRLITGQEASRMYDEWCTEGFIGDVPRRNFIQVPDTKQDWDYTAQGIALDTTFQRRSDGKIRDDSPSNYAGTITGACPPGKDGSGITFPSAAGCVSFGNVTQVNSVASFSIEWWQELPSGNIPVAYSIAKYLDTNDSVLLGPLGVAAAAKGVYFAVANGSNAYGISTLQMRAGTKQHFLAVFNGNGVGNAGRAQLYVDGEDGVLAGFGGTIPATTSAMTGQNLFTGYPTVSVPGTYNGERLYTASLTSVQARAAYLKHFAQQLLWRESFEDVPVTLAASVGAGVMIGEWKVISGTWKCSETTDGKKWLECVTAGAVSIPQPEGFGTVHYKQLHHSVAGATYMMFEASKSAAWNATGQNGYLLEHDTGGRLVFERETSGPDTDLFYTVGGYAANDVVHDYWINRRPSDGRFTAYIQGGAFTRPTLIDPTGGFGTNPSAGEATYTTSKWMIVSMAAGDKLLMFDPQDSRAGIQWYRGQLDPTKGEV